MHKYNPYIEKVYPLAGISNDAEPKIIQNFFK